MVRSKEVPKKPKDPLLTPPSKPRGFSFRDDGGFGGSLPRNRGGAAMSSPAPASVPNYMRATSSSGARAGQRQRAGVTPSSPSASTPTRQRRPVRVVPRGKVLFPAPAASPGMVRPTCSSTLKDAKFPGALDLAPGATDAEGPAAMRVCPYTYCSLNGHAHAPAVPLRSFLAKRRRLIKTQQSMKHRGVSAFRRTTNTGHQRPDAKNSGGPGVRAPVAKVDEEALGDFFVEVYTGPRVSSGTSCSDMSLDEMDATVRRMEFVVFDRCTDDDDDDNNRGNDLGVHGDGDGEGMPEERLGGVCSDSSSEFSDADTSGDLVEELPWMRYECDSLDDDVSEEQGVIPEETEVLAQGQEGGEDEEGTSGRFGDEGEEECDEEPKPEGDEIISDLPREMGIVAEEEGISCRVDTVYQQEDSRGEERQDPGVDLSEVAHKMEIATEQASTVEVCKVQEEKVEDRSEEISESEVAERLENVLKEICKEENSADQEANDDETSMQSASAGQLEVAEKQEEGESEMEIAETVPEVTCKEDSSEQEATCRAVSEGKISDSSAIGSPDVEISHEPRNGSFEQDMNSVEDAFEQDVNTVEDAFDTTAENIASGTEDARMGLEIATCKSVDASEESGIAHDRSQDLNSVCVDAPVQMEPEITEHKSEDSSEESSFPQESSQNGKSAHVDNGAQIEVSADAPAQMVPEITECKLEQSSEESGIAQESSQDFNSVCVDAPAKMEPEITEREPEDSSEESSIPQESSQNITSAHVDNGAQIEVSADDPAQMVPEITECKPEESSEESGISSQDFNSVCVGAPVQMEPEITERQPEDSSEESSIPQEISQNSKSAHVDNGAQIEVSADAPAQMVPEITECKLEESSEESGIPQESSQSDESALGNNGAETEPEFTTCKSEDSYEEESGVAQEIVHDDNNSAYLGEGSRMQLGNVPSELEDTPESIIAHEIGEDENSAYASDDAQNGSEITTCQLDDASESVTVQEAGQDHSCVDVSGGAQNESELTTSELVNASEGSDVTQEDGRDDNTADVNDGPKKEPETMACESEHAQEGLDITQIGHEDGYSAGALKDTKIMTRKTKDACEEVCITEEVNLSPVVQIPQHNSDLSATDGNGEPESLPAEDSTGEPQSLPAKENDAKEFSVDDMCSVFSGMNLKGDVYVDPTESDISPRKRLIIAGRRRTPEEEEHMRGFNPRAPNFLPLELDPDSEKVDLKHQTAEDRKNAEEWMIDYALRRAVNNLGGRKKKVELLVQAFETVLPHDEDEKKNISPTRPVQACN